VCSITSAVGSPSFTIEFPALSGRLACLATNVAPALSKQTL
jgi:hypothetical protein